MAVVDDASLDRWRSVGWLHLPGALAPPEISSLTTWVDEVAGWAADGGPGLHHHEATDSGPALARSEDLIDRHDALAAFVTTGRIVDIASALLGELAVLFKEKINYKQPGGAGFAPHQDAPAYRFVDHHVSCLVAVDAASLTSGCLEVAPGYERGLLANDRGRLSGEVVAGLAWQPLPVEAGDLVFFDSYTPHRSGTNDSDGPRRALYLTYNAASAGEWRSRYYADKRAEFEEAGDRSEAGTVRLSISDDFLGRPVETER